MDNPRNHSSHEADGVDLPSKTAAQQQSTSTSIASSTADQAVATAAPAPANTSAPAPAVPLASAPVKQGYKPQFADYSPSTQVILDRVRGHGAGFNSAMANSLSSFTPSDFANMKQRVMSTMSTSDSLTLKWPAPSPQPARKSKASPKPVATPSPAAKMAISLTARPRPRPSPGNGMSAIRKVQAGLNARGRPKAEVKVPTSSRAKAPARASNKRKRARSDNDYSLSEEDDDDDDDDDDEDDYGTPTATLTTKSGRHVTKPTTYNPAAMDKLTKRTYYGKRTPDQALCKVCTRSAYTSRNQMVFCDGCDEPWHQRCHDPWIEDSVLNEEDAKWFCATCASKREKKDAKRPKHEQRASPIVPAWTYGQKSAHLRGMTPDEAVEVFEVCVRSGALSMDEIAQLLMRAHERRPDLPLLPAEAEGSGHNGIGNHAVIKEEDLDPHGPINFIRKVSAQPAVAKTNGNGVKTVVATSAFEPDDEDVAGNMEAWPAAGRGLYSELPREDVDGALVDADYDPFSHNVMVDGEYVRQRDLRAIDRD